jgi:ribosome-binding ATPase YchF (GTP1/OBG family)
LVGKPSVGKSTFFNAATMNDVPEGAYPFTTIDPSLGEAYVRVDCAAPEFEETCTPNVGVCRDGVRYVPVKMVDVAGLIPGAHEGAGLGNQFLTDLNEADVLVHVVDFSGRTDAEGEPTEGHDPREDIDFLEDELDAWYREILGKGIERYDSLYQGPNPGDETGVEEVLAEQMSAFRTSEAELERLLRRLSLSEEPNDWDEKDRTELAREIRRETKPIVVVANKMDVPEARDHYEAVVEDPDYDHLMVVPASAHAEKALKRADEKGVVEYRPGDATFDVVGDVSGEQRAGLDRIAGFCGTYDGTGVQTALETAVFDVLGAKAVFPGSEGGLGTEDGKLLQDCFLLPGDATAEEFAYFLHTDIGEGFLHAVDCRDGRQVGAATELDHRDVVEVITTN